MLRTAAEFLHQQDDLLLIAHVSPDGDTLGASLALSRTLFLMGKRVQVVCEDPVPAAYAFLPGAESVLRPEAARKTPAVVAVDCADIERTGEAKTLLTHAQYTLNIDHHGTNTGYAQENYVQHTAAAGELIYRLIQELSAPIDKEIATCLYTALATDTGNFSYSNTTPDTFRIAGELLSCGIDLSALNRKLFRDIPFPKARLRARAVEKLRVECDGRLGISALSLKDFSDCGASAEDNEGVIDAIRDIDTLEIAALLRECADGSVRASLRGKQEADVASVAVRFGGGGHKLAAGCTLHGGLEAAAAQLLPLLKALLSGAEG